MRTRRITLQTAGRNFPIPMGMQRLISAICYLTIFLLPSPGAELLSVQKIWDAAPHNAFTDLIRYRNEWLCAFREGKGHVSGDGAIHIITSKDGTNWQSWAHVRMPGVDLRDPKICLTPAGELMLTTAGARRDQKPVPHQSYSWFTRDGKTWRGRFAIGDANMWLWRVTWHKDTAYSVGYDTAGEKFARLYRSKDGEKFESVVPNFFDKGYPNETGFLFPDDDTALCLLRRDGPGTESTAMLGQAKPPYTDWRWQDLGVRIGGPHVIQLPDKRLIAAVRLYDGKVRTSVVQIDSQKPALSEMLPLPSGGDTSYAGLIWHDGNLFVSYYSSHESRTAIYFARVKL